MAGNEICGTVGVKSGIPDRLSLIFHVLVPMLLYPYPHNPQCQNNSAINILFRVNKAPTTGNSITYDPCHIIAQSAVISAVKMKAT